MLDEKTVHDLIETAIRARKNAYAPYSHYFVGAALLSADGKVWTGANIENASYGVGLCAERTAIFAAAASGVRSISAIAITAAPEEVDVDTLDAAKARELGLAYPTPCGACRQVMREFAVPKEFQLILARSRDDYVVRTLEDLLPMSFGPEFLQEAGE